MTEKRSSWNKERRGVREEEIARAKEAAMSAQKILGEGVFAMARRAGGLLYPTVNSSVLSFLILE